MPLRPVPDVADKTLDEAIALLTGVGITATAGAQEYHDTVKSTNPNAGTTIHRGDTIKVKFT